MRMSQRILFWHQNLLKIMVFEKIGKKNLVKKNGQPKKSNFELKMQGHYFKTNV